MPVVRFIAVIGINRQRISVEIASQRQFTRKRSRHSAAQAFQGQRAGCSKYSAVLFSYSQLHPACSYIDVILIVRFYWLRLCTYTKSTESDLYTSNPEYVNLAFQPTKEKLYDP
jgi:hypothetical protein